MAKLDWSKAGGSKYASTVYKPHSDQKQVMQTVHKKSGYWHLDQYAGEHITRLPLSYLEQVGAKLDLGSPTLQLVVLELQRRIISSRRLNKHID